jgi:hypothetical protein
VGVGVGETPDPPPQAGRASKDAKMTPFTTCFSMDSPKWILAEAENSHIDTKFLKTVPLSVNRHSGGGQT